MLSLAGDGDAVGAPGDRSRVLVVEDDPSMRLLCRINLQLGGFDVVTAATGDEGFARATSESFDIALLDVMLPDVGGFDLARRLREDARSKDLPIVFLSARGAEADIEQGWESGAIDYVVKPFDPLALPVRLLEDLEQLSHSGADIVRRHRFGR